MHEVEAKRIVNNFTQALCKNDMDTALQVLRPVKLQHFTSTQNLRYIHITYLDYIQKVAINRCHPLHLDKLVSFMANNTPASFFRLYAEVIYYNQVTFDNTYAYSIIQRTQDRYHNCIDDVFCQYACYTCIMLKRSTEAYMWINRGRTLVADKENSNHRIEAFYEAEVNLLQRMGKYEEALNILNEKCVCLNPDSYHFLFARMHYLLQAYKDAEKHILLATSACPDAHNYLQHAQILYATKRYNECIESANSARIQVEEEWGSDAHIAYVTSDLLERSNIEVYKLLIKASLKLGSTDTAQMYLDSAKHIVPYQEEWQDIEDLWPNTDDIFAQKLQEEIQRIATIYPRVPDKAAFFIARADVVANCLANPELWYDAVCRDRGLAFEIILRDIVCKGENTMDLAEMIGYVNSKPGDVLYGSQGLHILKNIRNKNSHAPAATAADAAESRRILFEEVLGKL